MKIIRKLPDLAPGQEWACENGCDSVRPQHYRNVYSMSWDRQGNLINELAEYYYTCGKGHVLMVWDQVLGDYVELSPEFYEE